MTAEPREGLRDTTPYLSPQLEIAARLNTNENPSPSPRGVFDELTQAIAELPLHLCPGGQMGRLPEELPRMDGRRHAYTAGIADGTSFYFVHSYAVGIDPALSFGVTDHGRSFSAAVAQANVFATQFHPEKSAAAGLELYGRFVEEVRAA